MKNTVNNENIIKTANYGNNINYVRQGKSETINHTGNTKKDEKSERAVYFENERNNCIAENNQVQEIMKKLEFMKALINIHLLIIIEIQESVKIL